MGFFDPSQVTYSPNLEPPGFNLLRQYLMSLIFQRGNNPYGTSPEGMGNIGDRPLVSNQPNMNFLSGFGYGNPQAGGPMGGSRIPPALGPRHFDGMQRNMPTPMPRRGGFGGPKPPQFPDLTPGNEWRRMGNRGSVSAPGGNPGGGMGRGVSSPNDYRRSGNRDVSSPFGPGAGPGAMGNVPGIGRSVPAPMPRMHTQPAMPSLPDMVSGFKNTMPHPPVNGMFQHMMDLIGPDRIPSVMTPPSRPGPVLGPLPGRPWPGGNTGINPGAPGPWNPPQPAFPQEPILNRRRS